MIRKVSFVTNELPAAPRFSLLFQVDDFSTGAHQIWRAPA